MKNDFDKRILELIWGSYPTCVQTSENSHREPIDFHHILGRGGSMGYPSFFSSVLNAIPIKRSIHQGPLRDAPDQRKVYLRLASGQVMSQVGMGNYTLKEKDYEFIKHCDNL